MNTKLLNIGIVIIILFFSIIITTSSTRTEITSIFEKDIVIINNAYNANLKTNHLIATVNGTETIFTKSTLIPGNDYIYVITYRTTLGYEYILKSKCLKLDLNKLMSLNNEDFKLILWKN